VLREKKGSVKISELDSNNRDVDRDSSESTNRRTHWDHLKYYPCTVGHTQLLRRAFFLLFSSPSHSSVRIPFSLPHFVREASRKTELQKNFLSAFGPLSALRNTRVFWRFVRKFHQEVNGSKPSLHWLAQLSENPVEGVCGRSLFAKQKIFLRAVFSNNFFRLKQTL